MEARLELSWLKSVPRTCLSGHNERTGSNYNSSYSSLHHMLSRFTATDQLCYTATDVKARKTSVEVASITIAKFQAASPARSAQMRPISADVARSVVCVGHTGELCKKRLNRSRCRLGLTRMDPRNHVFDGNPDTRGRGTFEGGTCAWTWYLASA